MTTTTPEALPDAVLAAIAETRRLYVGTPPNVDDTDVLAASVLDDVTERLRSALARGLAPDGLALREAFAELLGYACGCDALDGICEMHKVYGPGWGWDLLRDHPPTVAPDTLAAAWQALVIWLEQEYAKARYNPAANWTVAKQQGWLEALDLVLRHVVDAATLRQQASGS